MMIAPLIAGVIESAIARSVSQTIMRGVASESVVTGFVLILLVRSYDQVVLTCHRVSIINLLYVSI